MKINRTTEIQCLPTMLTVEEFMHFAPIPRSTSYSLLKRKKLLAVKVGRRILIPRASLVALLTPTKP